MIRSRRCWCGRQDPSGRNWCNPKTNKTWAVISSPRFAKQSFDLTKARTCLCDDLPLRRPAVAEVRDDTSPPLVKHAVRLEIVRLTDEEAAQVAGGEAQRKFKRQ